MVAGDWAGIKGHSYADGMQPTPTDAPLVVGFDLDMTLIDTAPGFGATLTRWVRSSASSSPSRR